MATAGQFRQMVLGSMMGNLKMEQRMGISERLDNLASAIKPNIKMDNW